MVLEEATRMETRIKLLRREGGGPRGGKDVKCSIHQWRFEHSKEGGGKKKKSRAPKWRKVRAALKCKPAGKS